MSVDALHFQDGMTISFLILIYVTVLPLHYVHKLSTCRGDRVCLYTSSLVFPLENGRILMKM
jgi:hypothetical protein